MWSWEITRLGSCSFSWSMTTSTSSGHRGLTSSAGLVADRENSAMAMPVDPAELPEAWRPADEPVLERLHSDRGAPMTSQCTAQLLADLGVTRSLSRPQVSDDNPFSEAQFKTLKYHVLVSRTVGEGQAKTLLSIVVPPEGTMPSAPPWRASRLTPEHGSTSGTPIRSMPAGNPCSVGGPLIPNARRR